MGSLYSDRTKGFEMSGIRRMFELARQMKDPVDFSLGQPDFDAPESVKLAAVEALKSGRNRYTVTAGIPELHSAIRQYFHRKYALDLKDKELLATSGATGAILLSLYTLVNPGDEVIIPDPSFVLYGHLVSLCGGIPVRVDTYANDFKITPADIAAHFSEKTKAIILNTPANPTGAAYTEDEIRALANALSGRNIFVISDEVYESFVYDSPHAPFMRYRSDKIIHIGAFSKTHGVPGWRLGYAISDPETIKHMMAFQQFIYVCPNSVAQWACAKGLADENIEKTIMKSYREKRDIACDVLGGSFEFVKPGGAFYIFPKSPGADADKFVEAALKEKVIIVPGRIFSRRNTHFRVSYAVDNAALRRGLKVLVDIARRVS